MPNKHLHPLAIPVKLIQNVKDWIPAIIGVAVWRSHWYVWLAVVTLIILWSLLDYFCWTYVLANDELVIYSGIFVKKQRHIPYQQIQNLQSQQWFFFKPFGVEQLAIDTGAQGKDASEVILPAVKVELAAAIENHRRAVQQADVVGNQHFEATPSTTNTSGNQRTAFDYQVSFRDLSVYALSNPNILGQIIFIIAIVDRIGAHRYIDQLTDEAGSQIQHGSWLIVLSFVLILVLVLLAVNLLRIFLQYYHFRLTRIGQDLTIQRGLLQTSTLHVAINRIQAINIRQSIFRQVFGLTTLDLDLIADSTSNDDDKKITLIPVLSNQTVYRVLHTLLASLPAEGPHLRHGDWYMTWLFVRNAMVIVALPLGGLAYFYHGYWFWWIAGMAMLLALGSGIYKGYYTSINLWQDHYLALRTSRQFTKETTLVGWHEIQSMSVTASLLMVWTKRANLVVSVRSGNTVRRLSYQYLPRQEVTAVMAWYQDYA